MIVEIDYETEERIVRGSLMESIVTMEHEIGCLLDNEDPLKSFQLEDLQDTLQNLTAMQTTAKYFTPHTEWPMIDAFDVDIDAVRLKIAEAELNNISIELSDDLGIDESAL